MSKVDEEIKQENIELRKWYLREFHCYSSTEIQELSPREPGDPTDLTLQWKQQKRIFSINNNDVEVFPSFQFSDGKPLKIISFVLNQIPEGMTSWQIAFWFVSANGYLNGEAPKDCLELKNDLEHAAKVLSQDVIG